MSNSNLEQIKRFVIEELRKSYSAPTVNLWFEPMKIFSLDGNVLTVQFPNDKKPFVEEQFYGVLKTRFSEVLGVECDLKMISSEEEDMIKKEEKKSPSAYKMRYNPEYTFENFVVGKSNQLAHSAALAVANHPFELNNPLYFYGNSGLGKTHLMFAIVNHIRAMHPEYNILYVTGEEFTIELVESLAQKRPMIFREKYRNLDVLLVDDIQFIAGKLSVQEEFFHTFDTLFKLNKQIILASDRAPKDIDNLEERLKSRFVMGLVADIQPPDLELRIAIFKRKASDFGFDLDMDVLYYLAQNITTNIRQIEGALKKLKAHALLNGVKCDLYVARSVLSDFFTQQKSEESVIDKIIEYAEKRYNVTSEEMKSPKRDSRIATARHVASYLISKATKLSMKEIAGIFNRTDHSTVHHSIRKVEQMIDKDAIFDREIKSFLSEIM